MARNAAIGALRVSLGLDSAQYSVGLKTASGATRRTFADIERRGKQMESRLSAMSRGFSTVWIKALAAVGAARGFQQLLDASTRIENALKVAGLAGSELTRVYDKLFDSAQKNAAPLEALVDLYGRASLVQKELGVSTEELLGFTNKVAVALRVSGKSASESSGALLQLSQALGSGIVRAEEFNSILEGALPIAQAAAAGLEEAGGSVAKLRQLVVDGKISSEAFFRAFEAGSVILSDKVAGAELTVSQGFVRLTNALIKATGQFDAATGTSDQLAGALGRVAEAVRLAGDYFEENGEKVQDFITLVKQAISLVPMLSPLVGGLALPEGYVGPFANQTPSGPKGPSGRGRPRGAPRIEAATVSFEDFAVKSDKAAKAASAAIDPLLARFEELSDVLALTHDPFEQMKLDLIDLETIWKDGRISVEQYEAAVAKTQLNTAASTLGMVGQLTGALSSMFEDNKAFAVANAVINTAEGITKALAQGGIFGYVGAAAVAASGAAQIAAIVSARPGSFSAPSVGSGSAAAATDPAKSSGTTVNLTLRGGGRYSRDEVEQLFRDMNDAMGDGLRLNVA